MTDLIKIPYSFIRPIYEKTSFHKAVISEIDDTRLRFAYSHCRNITRKHAKTFYMATRFLPYHKQRGIFAIYGLCRTLDDIVDENQDNPYQVRRSRDEIIGKLEKFRVQLVSAYRGAEQTNSVLIAFADVLNRYNISLEYPLTLLDGVKMDLVKNRYETFDELYEYSYKVASVVGLMTAEIFEYSNPQAINHAVELGIAMQLTNILRDIGEDLERDRVYIPAEDLEKFQVTEEEMFKNEISDRFIDLMKFQIQRARYYYKEADKGISMLNRDSRLPVLLARENYSRILNKIEENGYQVFNQRAYLNATEKFSILPKILFQLNTNS
ncbi:MAG: phytoene/squalene synthase family protein [Balneolaceae bacterium]|nr:phytoene/squalene synthase family protein [Balneolaceae bacterium]